MSGKDRAKPAEILEKIIGGKIAMIVNEVTLYGQDYVLDTNQKLEAVLTAAGAEVVGFQRLAVGEGIEKLVGDYAAGVMKHAGLSYAAPTPSPEECAGHRGRFFSPRGPDELPVGKAGVISCIFR